MRLAPAEAQLIKVKGSQIHRCAAQTMLIWPGLKLLGCVGRIRKGVRNGVLYTITSCEDDVKFEELPHSFTKDEIRENSRLAAAQTYASCQVTEFQEACTLHELGHTRFTWKHFFVGISRCRAAELVSCAQDKCE